MMSLNTSTHTLFNMQEIRHRDGRKLVPHVPRSECEHEDITVMWNKSIQIDREVLSNRTDIIIKNNKDKICVVGCHHIYMQRQPLVELFDNIYYNRTVYTDVLE
jgi:hypothetical protein